MENTEDPHIAEEPILDMDIREEGRSILLEECSRNPIPSILTTESSGTISLFSPRLEQQHHDPLGSYTAPLPIDQSLFEIILDSEHDKPYQPHSLPNLNMSAIAQTHIFPIQTPPHSGIETEHMRQKLESLLHEKSTEDSALFDKPWDLLSSPSKTAALPESAGSKPLSSSISSASTLSSSGISIAKSTSSLSMPATRLAADYQVKQTRDISAADTGTPSRWSQQSGPKCSRSRSSLATKKTGVSGHITITNQTPTMPCHPLTSANVSFMGLKHPVSMISTDFSSSHEEGEISLLQSTTLSIGEIPVTAVEICKILEAEFMKIYTSHYMDLTLDLTWRTSLMSIL
ncbi:hypothetical protein EV421DRAFT_1910865 [Armillaria borealis]|uniref:Uncharacterized protein n=1 Tax=Armillaria borealis TaxID=47425 RepID=A0AA39MG18_9AGAR|nr:hypothetical protein EV421DRAFT_1910865 [Armillaria borealis]